jgi:glycosyltransferase involved in cell wall biosynthesis
LAVRVLRIYHGGRDAAHRARERALTAAGVELTLVVPTSWPGTDDGGVVEDGMRVVELPVLRPGDVNRHRYAEPGDLAGAIAAADPDVLDVHEEPFSSAAAQALEAQSGSPPVVMYTAQNIDKRFPPPFSAYERRAQRLVSAFYPCSRQAASVVRGKGFAGRITIVPLGFDPQCFRRGDQSVDDAELRLTLVGRLVPEKGVKDAVQVLARLSASRPARLTLVGDGPERDAALRLAGRLALLEHVELKPWLSADELAGVYRRTHVVLVPSRATATWAEQFGRVIVEAQASGAVVAGYRSGSIPEVAGQAGLLARERDVDDLAQRISALVADSAEFERRREQGLELAGSRTWARVAEQQVALYEWAASRAATQVPARPLSATREHARAEFGPPAPTPSGERPFALPVLRSAPVSRVLGWAVDATTGLLGGLRRRAG